MRQSQTRAQYEARLASAARTIRAARDAAEDLRLEGDVFDLEEVHAHLQIMLRQSLRGTRKLKGQLSLQGGE